MLPRRLVQNEEVMFVTTNTFKRIPFFTKPSHAREAIECLYRVHAIRPFLLYGFVIMPDHCHFLLKVLSPNTISMLMNTYKSGLTFDIGLPKLWQPRFDLRIIETGIGNVLRYIHMNPVKKGMVDQPQDYPWSSASGKWDVTPLGAG